METIDVFVSDRTDFSKVECAVEQCVEEEGLTVTLKGSLSAYPGSLHWHLKRGKETGTLELTVWPKKRRIWFSVQAKRKGDWIPEAVQRLQAAIQAKING